jgi:hypothetical protein
MTTFAYKMGGKYYARMKSSLRGKRVKRDVAFKETMRYAVLLANTARLASQLYRELPVESRGIRVYRSLTGKAMRLLKEGKTAKEILSMLSQPGKAPVAQRKLNFRTDIQSHLYADRVIASVLESSFRGDDVSDIVVADAIPP